MLVEKWHGQCGYQSTTQYPKCIFIVDSNMVLPVALKNHRLQQHLPGERCIAAAAAVTAFFFQARLSNHIICYTNAGLQDVFALLL
jgi:hypothetical protein